MNLSDIFLRLIQLRRRGMKLMLLKAQGRLANTAGSPEHQWAYFTALFKDHAVYTHKVVSTNTHTYTKIKRLLN